MQERFELFALIKRYF